MVLFILTLIVHWYHIYIGTAILVLYLLLSIIAQNMYWHPLVLFIVIIIIKFLGKGIAQMLLYYVHWYCPSLHKIQSICPCLKNFKKVTPYAHVLKIEKRWPQCPCLKNFKKVTPYAHVLKIVKR